MSWCYIFKQDRGEWVFDTDRVTLEAAGPGRTTRSTPSSAGRPESRICRRPRVRLVSSEDRRRLPPDRHGPLLLSPCSLEHHRRLYKTQRILSPAVRYALRNDPPRWGILSAALADRLCGKRNERRRDEGRLRPGLGQPCAVLSASHGRGNPDRVAAGLVSGQIRRILGMSPGSDSDHPRTRRFISYKCIFCHNGIPRIPTGHEAPGSDPVFTGDLPEGIDCQRCHGPGGNHVRTAGSGVAKVAEIRAAS